MPSTRAPLRRGSCVSGLKSRNPPTDTGNMIHTKRTLASVTVAAALIAGSTEAMTAQFTRADIGPAHVSHQDPYGKGNTPRRTFLERLAAKRHNAARIRTLR